MGGRRSGAQRALRGRDYLAHQWSGGGPRHRGPEGGGGGGNLAAASRQPAPVIGGSLAIVSSSARDEWSTSAARVPSVPPRASSEGRSKYTSLRARLQPIWRNAASAALPRPFGAAFPKMPSLKTLHSRAAAVAVLYASVASFLLHQVQGESENSLLEQLRRLGGGPYSFTIEKKCPTCIRGAFASRDFRGTHLY